MNQKCDNCSFVADLKTFFRKERGGLLGVKKTVCEACHPYQATVYEQRVGLRALLSPITVLFLIILIAHNDSEQAAFLLTMLAASFPTLPLRILIHEAGHAFMARALGKEVWDVRIGRGPIKKRIRIRGVSFDIRRYGWISGCVHYFDPRNRHARVSTAAIVASGPLANLLMGGVAFGLSYALGGFGILAAIFAGFGLFNLLMGFYNLIPQRFGDDESTVSDGKLLLDLLKPQQQINPLISQMCRVTGYSRMQRYDDAVAAASEGWQTSPLRTHFATNIMHNLSRGRGDRAALDFYFSHPKELEDTDNVQADSEAGLYWVKANVAWSALKLGDENLRNIAAKTAKAAFDAEPDKPESQGTYGAWLVSVGESKLGLPLLTQAARNIDNPIDKADFCLFLADGWKQEGDLERAALFEALSQHLRHAA